MGKPSIRDILFGAGLRTRRRHLTIGIAVALGVVLAGTVASASTTSAGIVAISPHTLTGGSSIAGGKSLSWVVSGGATTVPTDATQVRFVVTVSREQKVGSLTAQPYLDAADASGDTLSWPAMNTAVTGTFLEPVGLSNKVSFTNTSAGSIFVVVKITGYSTAAGLETRLAAVEGKQSADEAAISSLQAKVSADENSISILQGKLSTDENTINALQSRLSFDENTIKELQAKASAVQVAISTLPGRLAITSAGSNGNFKAYFTGFNLAPNSAVTAHYTNSRSMTVTVPAGSAIQDGTYSGNELFFACGDATDIYLTGTDKWGDAVTSNTLARGAGCP